MSNIEQSKAVFDGFRKNFNTPYSIADLTATVCTLCGVEMPNECAGTPVAPVIDQSDKLMDGVGKTQKVVLFCADALGEYQRNHFKDDFERIDKCAGFRILSTAVMPSVTPVCYGTIFSGAAPCVHGIEKYEKPVLTVDTMFDAFARAGKNVAIVSCNNCSIDMIFRKRDVDYFSFRTDEASFDFSMKLIEEDYYDIIICYMTKYDSMMHKSGPFSPECTEQAKLAADRFCAFAGKLDECWKKYNRALVFVPDHGGHYVDEKRGGHGSDLPEDMLVNHYYRICEAE